GARACGHDAGGRSPARGGGEPRGAGARGKGDLDGALQAYEAARGLLQSVRARRPHDAHALGLAADAHNDVGRVLFGLGRPADAATAHTAALEASTASALPGRDPLFARAKSSMYLGRAKEALGALDEAEASFRRNLELARRLHADFPQDLELEDYLAISLNDLARVLRLEGRPAETEPLAEEALRFSEAALARDPGNALRIDGLSASHASLGRAREALGKLDGALAEFEADVKLTEGLLAKEPDNAFAQAALADGLTNLGRVERKRGRPVEARRAHERALALREGLAAKDESFLPDVGVSQLELGRVEKLERRDGRARLEQALALFQKLAGAADAPAKQRGRLAQVLLELGRVDEARPLVTALLDAGAADAELRALWDEQTRTGGR
ncbi:MAG: tetratricopeptide repeat protein, partial [Myxococcota bacterium]